MKKLLAVLLLLNLAVFSLLAQSASTSDFLAQGLQAYKEGNWDSAISLLKKAESMDETKGPDTLYMLIMAQMFHSDYKDVIANADRFLDQYPSSDYSAYVDYQKGRALYYLGNYQQAIEVMARFCNNNEKNEMFPSALFWMGECLYQTYHFEEAKGVFERVVNYYPDSAKYTEAVYRLDLITQREKEEKLLYLLKVTGEEFLASKSDFERELRQYKTSSSIDMKTQLDYVRSELAEKDKSLSIMTEENEKLKAQIKNLQAQLEEAQKVQNVTNNITNIKVNNANLEEIEELKKKAQKVQGLFEEENTDSNN
ncbi:MAG: tetratricopeptide repeat protein [Treponemataceae bacterium]|nr:tetratricopeptide repeat protein [Treponemataceae bacterium]